MQWPAEPLRIKPPGRSELIKLRWLIVAAFLALAALMLWLSHPSRIGDPLAYIALTLALGLRAMGWVFEWYNYWHISVPPPIAPRRDWTVDVLTTACPGEPKEMIVRTLRAMVDIRYPHTNYLCDEGNDPELREVCRQLGIVHVTRVEKKHAKAGNINNALSRASGQTSVVLDPDHEPAPYFLDRTLGYFEDPSVGFVQTVQPYRNQGAGLVARGAAQQTYHFYGPIMMGMHGYGTTQAIGANCVFRRAALDSIGGHASGLAEDMHTSMRLYSKGWRSVYVPESLTRGLVPSTLGAFFKQQLKWSCGAFDLLFQQYPKLWKGFTVWQRFHYGLCPVYFLRGLVGLLELIVPLMCLTLGWIAWRANVMQLLAMALPVLVLSTLIRIRAQAWLLEPQERGLHLAGGFLAAATWWPYLVGVTCAVFRVKVPYVPTPKDDEITDAWRIVIPNLAASALTVAATAYGISHDSSPQNVAMAAFGLTNAGVLTYVSILAQRKTLQSIQSRFNFLAPIRAALKPVTRSVVRVHDASLAFVREHSVLPVVIALVIIALCYFGLAKPKNERTEFMHDGVAKLKNTGGFYTGIYLFEPDVAALPAVIEGVQKKLDFQFRIVSIYQRWGPDSLTHFPDAALRKICKQGSVPMITWEPWTDGFPDASEDLKNNRRILASIAKGELDAYIRAYAERLQALGEPVLIRFAHEPDNRQYPWSPAGGDTPADFIAAWRHVVNLYNARGASNVGWVFSPWTPRAVADYNPGEGYVDWIGLTTLNYGHAAHDGKWRSFKEIYDPFRAAVKAQHLPVMLAEFGTTAWGGDRAAWLTEALAEAAKHDEIRSVVFFHNELDRNWVTDWRPPGGAKVIDWTFLSDAPVTDAVKAALTLKPYAGGRADARPPDQPFWGDTPVVSTSSARVTGTPGNFQLMVDGKPFYIRGIAYNPAHDWRDGNFHSRAGNSTTT